MKQRKGWRMSCDVVKATEGLENELWRRWSGGKVGEWALLILQTFHHFTYVTAHSPTLPSLHLRHSSFYNPSVASYTSQLNLQPFFRFSYVTDHHLCQRRWSDLRHSSFSNPSVASPTSSSFPNPSVASSTSQLIIQPFFRFSYVTDIHLCHLASRPCQRRNMIQGQNHFQEETNLQKSVVYSSELWKMRQGFLFCGRGKDFRKFWTHQSKLCGQRPQQLVLNLGIMCFKNLHKKDVMNWPS